MAQSPSDQTPNNKRTKTTRGSARTEKKKRLTTASIASITPVNLDSDTDEGEMATNNENGPPEGEDLAVTKKPPVIAVGDLERLLDKRFAAEQISKMGEQIGRNEDKISEICLLYTSPSPRDRQKSRMPSSA